jgi:hypothetical protein
MNIMMIYWAVVSLVFTVLEIYSIATGGEWHFEAIMSALCLILCKQEKIT